MTSDNMKERDFLQSIRHLVQGVIGSKLEFDEDASDIPVDDDLHVVINVDTFVRESDWLPGMTAAQAGRKTAVMTISDIVAKGALPKATMLSLCIPESYDQAEAREMIRGFSQYGLKHGIPFIGGDLGSANDVVLTGVGIGTAPPKGIVTRRGTKESDIIAVTGEFGLTTLAYRHLLHGLELPSQIRNDALAAAYNPHIHHDFIAALSKEGAVDASMDSSDGLGITLHTMSNLCGLAFEIESLPLSLELELFAREQFLSEMKIAMLGGEEFILVISIPEDKIERAQEIALSQKVPLIEIGFAKRGTGVKYESSEGYIDIPSEGYDSLKGWD